MAGEVVSAPSKALAAVAVNARATELREFAIPEIAPDAGLLRIEATGICGSDWPMYLNAKPGPRILGHEMIGTIAKLGDIARERWGVTEGDRVALEEYLPCGHCEYCRTGEYRSCLATDSSLPGAIRYGSTPLTVAPSLWGGYSQYLYMHPRTVLHRVPAGVPHHIAAMALPIGNGFQWAYLDGEAGPGKTVVILGPGQQGLGCVIAAKAVGADCIIISGLARDERRLGVAHELGAHHTIMADQEESGGGGPADHRRAHGRYRHRCERRRSGDRQRIAAAAAQARQAADRRAQGRDRPVRSRSGDRQADQTVRHARAQF